MKYLLNIIAVGFLATSLTGCIVVGNHDDWDDESWQREQRQNRELISQLELNADINSVRSQLGTPNFSEASTHGPDQYQVLFYRTQRIHSDGDTSKDETTPLIFKNNRLIAWGNDALKRLEH